MRRAPLGELRAAGKKEGKMTVSNLNQLSSFKLMKNPVIVKDLHLKFAHSRKFAADNPDLIRKIDSMMEDAAWSA